MKKLKSSLLLLLLVSFAVTTSAQITYIGGKLGVNNASTNTFYSFNAKDWTGMYMTCKSSNFLQFDLTPANPRIAGTGNQVVFYNTQTQTFNSIQVANVYNYSDARAKENVQTLKSGLSSVLSLRPVSYKWKREAVVQSLSSEPSEKENITSTVANGPVEDDQTQYGFLAQEVEEVLPDAIKTDAEGHKMINYTAIIPMLVQAVQELQATVETQAQRIEQLSNGKGTQLIGDANNKILSCSPNPTNGFVTITTQLDNDVKSAKIIISSLMGSREKELTVSPQSPTASTSISSLNSGIYIVSLFVNGKLADYQRLIKE